MRGRILTLGLLLPAALAASAAPSRSWPRDGPAPREVRYQRTDRSFPNPERGFYTMIKTDRPARLEGLRARGITLVLVEIDLKPFKDRDLTTEKLAEVRGAFGAIRQHGLKAVVRAAYGFTGRDYRADPEDMGRILGHIRQLGEVFRQERDVLYSVQAGMLGPWGEWHGSNWGDPPSLEARRAVLFGWLDALPESVTVQIRRPMFIRDIFKDEPGGSTLTAESAYGGSRLSRTGWHNDALLAMPSDMGTYAQRGWDRGRELDWCDDHGRYTPFGGESVPLSEKTPIGQVVRELEQLHATYLNIGYHRGTLEGWRKAEYQGENGFEHVDRRLGYRFVAERLKLTAGADGGGSLGVELTLRNEGFAPPHAPRGVALVLSRGGPTVRVAVPDADPRRWTPEAGTVTVRASVPVPDDAPADGWRLAVHLADPSPALRDDGRYAVRLANEGIPFDEATGLNLLAEGVRVRPR